MSSPKIFVLILLAIPIVVLSITLVNVVRRYSPENSEQSAVTGFSLAMFLGPLIGLFIAVIVMLP